MIRKAGVGGYSIRRPNTNNDLEVGLLHCGKNLGQSFDQNKLRRRRTCIGRRINTNNVTVRFEDSEICKVILCCFLTVNTLPLQALYRRTIRILLSEHALKERYHNTEGETHLTCRRCDNGGIESSKKSGN